MAVRILSFVALAAGIMLVALLVLGGGEDYRVSVVLENASQLVEGNRVTVGGNPVGSVTDISLDDRNRAVVELRVDDEDLVPLHRGTRAVVRATSLSGVANRYVALEPGPNDAPPIDDGGTIPATDSQPTVDLDHVLNSLDLETRTSLSTVVRRSADQWDGVEAQANRGLAALNPALAQTAATTAALSRDDAALARAIVESAAVSTAVAERDTELESGLAGAAATAQAVAGERAALDSLLVRTPDLLRRANTTLVNLRATLGDLRPVLREARPVAPRLAANLRVLAPLARTARPAVADLRALVPDADAALRDLPAVGRTARPTFGSATRALRDASPVVAGLRPYVPDVVAGLVNGFGGTTAGYYDANGHYVRISFQGGPFSLNNSGSLVPTPPGDGGGLRGYRRGVDARCPGAATQPAADRSNPWLTPEAPCDPEDSPR